MIKEIGEYNMTIGEKILKFDNLIENESTVRMFEEVFKLTLDAEKSAIVEIGEPEIGGKRTIFINGKETVVNMENISEVGIKPYTSRKNKYWK